MQYVEDVGREGWILVDRGFDNKIDQFQPCAPCFEINGAIREAAGVPREALSELSLCPKCQTEFETKSLIDEILDRRLANLDGATSGRPEENPWAGLFPLEDPDPFSDR